MFDRSALDEWAKQAEERWQQRTPTAESAGWLERVSAAVRIENQAVAAQLAAIGELFRYRLAQSSTETEEWAIDTMDAVAAEVAAGLRISQRLALERVGYARSMHERLPQVAQVFAAGDIGYYAFSTIVLRTELIVDAEVLAKVDQRVAANVGRWPSLTRGRLAAKVDAIVARVDADAARRRKERQVGREIWISPAHDGVCEIGGSLFSTDAHARDQRLNALAATVCEHDPRSHAARRADAMGALAAGADRLGCRCGRAECAAGARRPASPVIIHVIASQDTLNRTATEPGGRDQRRRIDHPRTADRARRISEVGAAGPPRLSRPRARLPPLQSIGRFRARPRPDVSLARLRCPRKPLPARPHHPLRPRRHNPCRQHQVLLPHAIATGLNTLWSR